MKGTPRSQKLWDPSVALVKKWVEPMSVWEEGVACRFDIVCGGGWCEVLCCESSARERKKRVGEVGQVVWQQEKMLAEAQMVWSARWNVCWWSVWLR